MKQKNIDNAKFNIMDIVLFPVMEYFKISTRM